MNIGPSANKTVATPPADGLDRLLQAHLASPAEQLAPSSGFVLSVMDSIQQQASAPPPIAFPWQRVIPGAIAILCALAAFVLVLPGLRHAGPEVGLGPRAHQLLASPALASNALALCLVFLAACVSVTVVAASFRMAGRSR